MATGIFGGFAFVRGDETYAEEFIGVFRLWEMNLFAEAPRVQEMWEL